jgi:hypothetical protein
VAGKVSESGVRETPGGATPLPERATVWERNWSEMVRVAERAPEAVGEKVTLKAQVEFAARELPQALVTAKSPGETLAAMRVRATPPLLVRVTFWAGLVVPMVCCAKVRDVVESVSVAGALPVPTRVAVWVPMLSVMESEAERVPAAVGVKAMETVHPVEEGRVEPQVLAVMAKSVDSPVMTGVWRVAGLPPVLEMVMFCTAVVWLTRVVAKVRDVGVRTMEAGIIPVPDSRTV